MTDVVKQNFSEDILDSKAIDHIYLVYFVVLEILS